MTKPLNESNHQVAMNLQVDRMSITSSCSSSSPLLPPALPPSSPRKRTLKFQLHQQQEVRNEKEEERQRSLLGYGVAPSAPCYLSSNPMFLKMHEQQYKYWPKQSNFSVNPAVDSDPAAASPFKRRRRFQRRNSKTAAMLFKTMPIPTISSLMDESDEESSETSTKNSGTQMEASSATTASLPGMTTTDATRISSNVKWDKEMQVAHDLVKHILEQKRQRQQLQKEQQQQQQQSKA